MIIEKNHNFSTETDNIPNNMADNIVDQPIQQQSTDQQELATLMQISLNGGVMPQSADQQPSPTPIEPAAPVTPEPAPSTTVDYFAPIKEKFGFENSDAAIQEIEQLRAFKASPTVAEIKFENTDSEKVFKALQSGKLNEVYDILAQQQKLNTFTGGDVTKDNAADIIKLGMQLKYKDLTPEEINYKYNKQYAIPAEPIQKDTETDEDFVLRKSAWQEQVRDIEMTRIIDAKLSRPELESAKSKLVFPEIDNTPDQAYLQWQKSMEEAAKMDVIVAQAYGQMKPEVAEFKMPFSDEPNKVAFDFQFTPDADSFKEALDMAVDQSKLHSKFIKSDGTPDREKYARFLYFGMNAEKIILQAMNQAKNATIKANLPDNTQGGLVRQITPHTQEPNELDQLMAAAGIKR